MKIAFVLGSFITPFNGGASSVFTVKERIDQTHKTISSIRKMCPSAEIIMVEGSDTDISDCNFKYDQLIRPTNDDKTKESIYSATKSSGECIMMLYAANEVHLEDYDLVFKISGRYTLTEEFSLDNFSKEKFTFYDHVQWGYETTLYSFPGKLKDIWVDALKKSLLYMTSQKTNSVEIAIRQRLNVKYVYGAEKLGIQGYNAPMKRFIKY